MNHPEIPHHHPSPNAHDGDGDLDDGYVNERLAHVHGNENEKPVNPAQGALWYAHAMHHHDADHHVDADAHE